MAAQKKLDRLDRQILTALSESSQGSYRQLAKRIDSHPTTLIQRMKSLESREVIRGYRAKLDYFKMGFSYMGIVQIYSDDIVQAEKDLSAIDEVMAVYDVTGEADAVAMVVCEDRDRFNTVIKRIGALKSVSKSNTSIILDVVKSPDDFIPNFSDEDAERPRRRRSGYVGIYEKCSVII